jgi:steroid 5-alpha reductase family enzyme
MLSYFSLNFVYDLFPHLLRIFIPSFLMQLLVNMPNSYFRVMDNFTGLIEFIPGVMWSLFYTWQTQNGPLQFRQIFVTLCVVLWSLRLGGFLVYRMFVLGPLDSRIDDLVKKYGRFGIVGFWIGPHEFWSVICCLPVALLHAFPILDVKFSILDFIGLVFWTCGLFMEAYADDSKLKAKLAKTKNYYCLGSMWKYCRNPNHCGEVFCWLGLSIIAHNLFFYHPLYRYNLFIVILSLISPLFTLFAMLCEATLGSEIKNNKRFGNQIDYRQYRKQTSLLWPISPEFYRHFPKSIRKIVFFELDMYNKGLKQEKF